MGFGKRISAAGWFGNLNKPSCPAKKSVYEFTVSLRGLLKKSSSGDIAFSGKAAFVRSPDLPLRKHPPLPSLVRGVKKAMRSRRAEGALLFLAPLIRGGYALDKGFFNDPFKGGAIKTRRLTTPSFRYD